MNVTAPYTLTGEVGKAHGEVSYSLAALGVIDAVLKLRSLDADTLTFSIQDNGRRPAIPEDSQWLTLRDQTGVVRFTGIAKRSFRFPEMIYTYEVSNVYQGMLETSLLSNGRPFITYFADDAARILTDILRRASAAGLAVQGGVMPPLFTVPKMSFRASSYAGAIEDVLKWLPDVTSRMDYATTPPTLRFFTRASSSVTTLDLSGVQKVDEAELTPYPEARALGVAFAYARRDGDNIVNFLVQSAGDDTAEARRKISLYLSGQERSDMLVTEALTTAQKAVAMARASVDAVGASIDAAAASAQIQLTWASLYPRDSNLVAAVAAQPGFTMGVAGGSVSLYSLIGCGLGSSGTNFNSGSVVAVSLKTSGGAASTGWYPIVTGAFSTAELATAGATKETRYLVGGMYCFIPSSGSPGAFSLPSGSRFQVTGWTQSYTPDCAKTNDYYQSYMFYTGYNVAVDAINMPPAAVAAAVKAAAASGSASFIERAEFVEAPPDLAQNYFERQDWTPYKGSISMSPTAPNFPAPGDFLNILGTGTPAEWATMKAPVSELSIDLRTGAATVAVGPSPRMDFSSLVDRLRIPPEDNYQPG